MIDNTLKIIEYKEECSSFKTAENEIVVGVDSDYIRFEFTYDDGDD